MDSTAGPLNQLISDALVVIAPHVPRDLTWPILLLTAGLATTIWLLRKGVGAKGADGRVRRMPLRQFLLPAEIYTHVSARVDVGLYVFERLLRPLWVTTLLVGIAPGTEALVMDALSALLGSRPGLQSHYGWMLLYSLVTLLLYDLLFFLIHYAEHKIPVLWAIHKVHHSAEVLTPLTRYREHFLEGPIYAIGAALSFGIAAGLFGWLFNDSIAQARCSILAFLHCYSASTAPFVIITWLFTTLVGSRNGCTAP